MSGLLERFRNGDRHALARLLTHVENQSPLGNRALEELHRWHGNATIIGVTGPPGAGKSTLVNEMVTAIRGRGDRVAVLAVDPSSPFSGGALLGDRIRMLRSQSDDGVYIRSMASRGRIGGLATAAFGASIVLDRFGFDWIIIETVGTGQDEVDIASLADVVLLLQTPGAGDSIQTVKAGILEIADVLVVNKADLPGARELIRDLRQLVRMDQDSSRETPIVPVIASSGEGVSELLGAVDTTLDTREDLGASESRDNQRVRFHAKMLAMAEFEQWLNDQKAAGEEVAKSPFELSRNLLDQFARARLGSRR